MKKLLAIALALVLVFSLASCSLTAKESSEESGESSGESSRTRRERKEQERAEAEAEAEREREREQEQRASEQEVEGSHGSGGIWQGYVEPQLDPGMGTVLPSLVTPAGAASLFMRNMRDWNIAGAVRCFSDYDEYTEYYDDSVVTMNDDSYYKLVAKMMKHSEFSIISEEIYGSSAQVYVQVKAVSGEAVMDMYYEQLQELFGYGYGYGDPSYDSAAEVIDALNFDILPKVKLDAYAYLVMGPDGLWRMDADAYDNDSVMNALSGNIISAMDSYYYGYGGYDYYNYDDPYGFYDYYNDPYGYYGYNDPYGSYDYYGEYA